MHAEASTRCMDCRRCRQSGLYCAVLCIGFLMLQRRGGRREQKVGLKERAARRAAVQSALHALRMSKGSNGAMYSRQREAEHAQRPGLLFASRCHSQKRGAPHAPTDTGSLLPPCSSAPGGNRCHSLALWIRSALCWHIAQHPACSKAVWNQHIFTPRLESLLMYHPLNTQLQSPKPCNNYMQASPEGIATGLPWPSLCAS